VKLTGETAGVGPEPSPALHPNGSAFEHVALLLQGGGALGAYQAGVYEALIATGIEPDWVAGISIGAINSAIIAGNPRDKRVERLRAFWELVSAPGDGGFADFWTRAITGDFGRSWINAMSAGQILATGVPGFFIPRVPPPYLVPHGRTGATSWYDNSDLRKTLERLVDFERINARATRFSIGAVNVRTGNFAYFDNHAQPIGPEHVMASAALPPAFAPVEIDGESYWDGGLVSNTPLDWVLSQRSDLDTLVFQVDLWPARGQLPGDLSEVALRMKEIQYSSRTRAETDQFRRLQRLRAVFNELMQKAPPELLATPEAKLLLRASDPAVYNIVQLIYYAQAFEGQSKDYEFSRRTMEDHWQAGRRDAEKTLAHPAVLTRPTGPHAVKVYDFTTPSPKGAGHEP
jgi:NTE family protein